jgi:hypothetical protein
MSVISSTEYWTEKYYSSRNFHSRTIHFQKLCKKSLFLKFHKYFWFLFLKFELYCIQNMYQNIYWVKSSKPERIIGTVAFSDVPVLFSKFLNLFFAHFKKKKPFSLRNFNFFRWCFKFFRTQLYDLFKYRIKITTWINFSYTFALCTFGSRYVFLSLNRIFSNFSLAQIWRKYMFK